MRKIREVLRLWAAGKSQRQIAASVGIGGSTVGDFVSRARRAGTDAANGPDTRCWNAPGRDPDGTVCRRFANT